MRFTLFINYYKILFLIDVRCPPLFYFFFNFNFTYFYLFL